MFHRQEIVAISTVTENNRDNEKCKVNKQNSRLMLLLLHYTRPFRSSLLIPFLSPQRYRSPHLEAEVSDT